MTSLRLFSIVGVAACCLALIRADESAMPEGFKPLCNGVDLKDWEPNNGKLDAWSIKDGIITAKGKPGGWLLTKKEYADYELRLEYRLSAGANSGVTLRSPLAGEPTYTGLKIQLTDLPDRPPNELTGAIWGAIAPTRHAAKPAGEWNQLRIVVKDRRITVRINDVQVLDEDLRRHEQHYGRFPGMQQVRGRIGLQSHVGTAEFRNLIVKDGTVGSENQPLLVLNAGGHTDGVTWVAFTPDGKQVISVSLDKTICVWDVATGELRRVLRLPIGPGRAGDLNSLALSRDGKTLAAAGIGLTDKDHWIYLLGMPAGRVVRVLKGHSKEVRCLDFSRDGNHLASASNDGACRVWNVKTGQCEQTLSGHEGGLSSVAFSPDGKRLVTGGGVDGKIWSVETGRLEALLQDAGGKQLSVGGGPGSVAWSPDGKTIAGRPGGICLWDPAGKLVKRLAYVATEITGSGLIFTAGSKEVLIGSDVVNVDTGAVRLRFRGHENGSFRTSLSANGKLAVTGGYHGTELTIWQTDNGSVVRHLVGQGQTCWSAGWSSDGGTVAWGGSRLDNKSQVGNAINPLERSFNLADLEFRSLPDRSFVQANAQRGSLNLVRNSNGFCVREDEKVVHVLKPPLTVKCWTLIPNSDLAAVGGWPGLVLFDVKTGRQVRRLEGHTGDVRAVSATKDGRYLLSGSSDQTLRIWKTDQSRPLLSLFFAGKEWIAWTPEGYYAASINGERLMGWQINNGREQTAAFHPASRFRARLHRPDVIKLLLKEGSLSKALKAADAARGQETQLTDVTELLPPEVTVTTSADEGVAKKGKMTIKAEGRSQSADPIVALQLLIDERPYTGEKGLVTFADAKGGVVSAGWEIELPSGDHQVRVLARTRSSLGSSRGMAVLQEGNPAPAQKDPALYVFAVGVDAYEEAPKLKGAVNDATKLEGVFKDHSKPLFSSVETLRKTDKEASKQGILDGLAWLKKTMTPRDVAVFFFAGHGDRDEKKEFYLLPQDCKVKDLKGTALSRTEIKQALQGTPGRILVMLDACHSGAVGMLMDDLTRELMDEDCGVVVMCAAMSKEVALEAQGHGHLTRSVIEGLSGKAGKREGLVYLHHLEAYVIDSVAELSKNQQHPAVGKPTSLQSFAVSKPGRNDKRD